MNTKFPEEYAFRLFHNAGLGAVNDANVSNLQPFAGFVAAYIRIRILSWKPLFKSVDARAQTLLFSLPNGRGFQAVTKGSRVVVNSVGETLKIPLQLCSFGAAGSWGYSGNYALVTNYEYQTRGHEAQRYYHKISFLFSAQGNRVQSGQLPLRSFRCHDEVHSYIYHRLIGSMGLFAIRLRRELDIWFD